MRRPAETGDQLSRQIAAARLAGIKVHAMRLTCAELAEVGGGSGDVQIETMLDLVTREEFEVQRAVLLRTREKLDAMERAITVLEARLAEPGASKN